MNFIIQSLNIKILIHRIPCSLFIALNDWRVITLSNALTFIQLIVFYSSINPQKFIALLFYRRNSLLYLSSIVLCARLHATFLQTSCLRLVSFFFIITRYPLCVCVCLTMLLLPLRNNFYLLPRLLPSLLTLLPTHPRPRRPCLYPRAFIKASLCVDVGWGFAEAEWRANIALALPYTDANEITLKRPAADTASEP